MNKTGTYFTKLKSLNKEQLKDRFGMVKKAIEETHGIIKQQGEDIKSFIPITQKHLEFTKELRNEMEVMGNKMEIMGNKMGVMGNEMEVMRSEINKTKILCEYRNWIRDYVIIVKREAKFNNEELDCITDYWENEQEDEEQEEEEQEDEEQEDEEQEDEEQEDEKVDKRQEDEKEKNDVTMKLKKLEVFLQNDSLTLSEFMKLFRVREESNNTFHRDVQNPRKAKDKLKDGNFPKDLEQIKESLDKILDAILIQVKQ
ncbi:unnamed protein product [Rhizophagus irregularis]|nr:unnamed protein product [Rhizophagus irregularis]